MTTGKVAWTCPLARAQVDACRTVAVTMQARALERVNHSSDETDFASDIPHFQIEGNPVRLFLCPKLSTATSVEEVEATMTGTAQGTDIKVRIPGGGAIGTNAADLRYDAVRLVVASAVVHELVHAIQFVHDKDKYKHALIKTAWTNDPREVNAANSQKCLDEYYKVPAEFEAHAVQAAAEVYFSNPSIPDEGSFETEFKNTPLVERISARVGVGGDASDWWACFQAAAWAAYRSWVTP